MAKHIFIKSENLWPARLALLACALSFVFLWIEHTNLFVSKHEFYFFQHHTIQALMFFIFTLAILTWQSKKDLTMKPFIICLAIMMAFGGLVFMAKWFPKQNTYFSFERMHALLEVLLICLWWLLALCVRAPQEMRYIALSRRMWGCVWLALGLVSLGMIMQPFSLEAWLLNTIPDLNNTTSALLKLPLQFLAATLYLVFTCLILLRTQGLLMYGLSLLLCLILQNTFFYLSPENSSISFMSHILSILMLLTLISLLTKLNQHKKYIF